ncbi:MAG: triple tyrosine motif-containing protein [Cyclobacteriaceae bacterium]
MLILFLSIIGSSVSGQERMGFPMIKNFDSDEYLGGIQNWQIVQNDDGIIHVANNMGLLQYDGNNWRVFSIDDITRLRSIAISADGIIYAGCQGDFGYIIPDSAGVLNYHSLKALVPDQYSSFTETWKTYVIDGKVYFCTFENIYVYDGSSIEVITHTAKLDVSFFTGNKLYTQVPGHGLYEVHNGQFRAHYFTEYFADAFVADVISLAGDEILVVTKRKGIIKVSAKGFVPLNDKLNTIFSEAFVNTSILLNDGSMAIGTQHDGVYIIDQNGDILLHINNESGLLSRTILSLYEDENENLWVGQNNGISFIRLNSPFRIINERAGLPGTGYSAVESNGNIYLGTNNGVYIANNDSGNRLVSGTLGQVYSLQQIYGTVFLGHGTGAYKIIDDRSVRLPGSSLGVWTYQPIRDKLIKGTYKGIQILSKDGGVELGNLEGLDESARVIFVQDDSTIWMSHVYRGIYKIDLDRENILSASIELFNAENKLPGDLYNAVHEIEGKLKISTKAGVYEYRDGSFIVDEKLNKHFEGEKITVLKDDIYGNIYFITDQNVGMLSKQRNGEYEKHTGSFNPVRKLINDDLPNINIIGSNLVLFGAKEGFIVFDRNLMGRNDNEVFNTMIRKVEFEGKETQLAYGGNRNTVKGTRRNTDGEDWETPFANNTVSFSFSASSFNPTTSPQFQYRLIGFEEQWQEWTTSNFKEYTNLREGIYTFEVRAKNAREELSEIARFSFTVLNPWYRSVLAYVFYFLAGVSVFTLLIIAQNKKHAREKKALDEKRRLELSDKEMQLDTITKQSEDEINQLKNEKLLSEIRYKNSELASNTMHILNKNEFINGIKSTLAGVAKKSTNATVKNQIKSIVKKIEKNIEADDDWQNFQIHFDRVHGDFSTRLKNEFPTLSPQDAKLSAYLRLNLSTKEIANLLNISVRGVEIARYRLRKKLGLERNQNLVEYLLKY